MKREIEKQKNMMFFILLIEIIEIRDFLVLALAKQIIHDHSVLPSNTRYKIAANLAAAASENIRQT
jgi:hypothetical protein